MRYGLGVAAMAAMVATPSGAVTQPKQVKCWHEVIGAKTYFYEQRFNVVAGKLQPAGAPFARVRRDSWGTVLMSGFKLSSATLSFSRGSQEGGPANSERYTLSGEFSRNLDGVSCIPYGGPVDPLCTAPRLPGPFRSTVQTGPTMLVERPFTPRISTHFANTIYIFDLTWNPVYPTGSLHNVLRIFLYHGNQKLAEYQFDATRMDPAAFVAETQAKLIGQVYPEDWNARRAAGAPMRNCL